MWHDFFFFDMNKQMHMRFSLFLYFALSFLSVQAQNTVDAERFARTTSYGTARSMGMGGAMSAVGADFSAATLNPAGLGLYRKSEFFLSPTLRIISNKTDLNDESNKASMSNFGFSSIGFVITGNPGRPRGQSEDEQEASSGFKLRSWTFAAGMNQLDQYSRRTNAGGWNQYNSMTDYYAAAAGNSTLDTVNQDFYYNLWYNYFIDTVQTANGTGWVPGILNGQVYQQYQRKETGRTNSWDFSFAVNLSDKLYFGVGLGLLDIRYSSDAILTETDSKNVYQVNDPANHLYNIKSFSVQDQYTTAGVGINGKLGIIYRPIDALRFALALQTPSLLTLTDSYTSNFQATFDSGTQFSPYNTGQGNFKYNLTTPFRVTFGTAFQIQKVAILSAEVDYTDYSTMNFSTASVGLGTPYSFSEENRDMSNLFSSAINYRAGAEFRFDKVYLRAGYAGFAPVWIKTAEKFDDINSYDASTGNFASPGFKTNRQIFSGGFGFRLKTFYMDLGISYQKDGQKFALYSLPGNYAADGYGVAPVVRNTRSMIRSVITFGFKF